MDSDIQFLITPIDEGGVGQDPQDVPMFDNVQEKIASMEGIEKADLDWDKIAQECESLLSQSCKDLRIANYLAYGYFMQTRFAGLTKGFALLDGLVRAEYCNDLHPYRKRKPEKARAATFEWLAKKLVKRIELLDIQSVDQLDYADDAIDAFTLLHESLKTYLGEHAPDFDELCRLFRGFQKAIDEDTKNNTPSVTNQTQSPDSSASEPAPKPATKPAQSSTLKKVEPSALSEMPSPTELNKALTSASNVIKNVAKHVSSSSNYDKNVFYWNRVAKYILLQELPASELLGQQPNEQVLSGLKRLESEGKHAELVSAAELEFNNGAIFCFRLHRYVYDGLIALKHHSAADVVLTSVQGFVSRFPAVLDTTFKGGIPFVDELTRAWLSTDNAQQPTEGDVGLETTVQEVGVFEEHVKNAQAMLVEGKLADAIQILEDAKNDSSSVQFKIKLQWELVKLINKSGKDELLVHLLDNLKEAIEETSVAKWQPELSKGVLVMLLKCHQRLRRTSNYEQSKMNRISQLQRELAVVDPVEAVKLFETQ